MGEWEWASDAIYRLAGVHTEAPAAPSKLAKLLGIDVYAVPGMIDMGSLASFAGRSVIGVRKSLPTAYREHAIGHELGHWVMRREGLSDCEEAADYIGAAIQAPRAAFRARVQQVGHNMAQLALPFAITETSAALRLGEVEGLPLAVVAPKTVRVRGDASWVWPDVETLRTWVRKPVPGLHSVRLGDDRRRSVVKVA